MLSESEIKRRIFERFLKRMKELQNNEPADALFCPELNPDVIVISEDRSFLFEPQNLRTTEWLHQHLGMEKLRVRDRIRVHPSQCEKMIGELKAAGFEVNEL